MYMLNLLKDNIGKSRDGHTIGLYECVCGNHKEIVNSRVRNGYTRSCGCLIGRKTKHGMKNTRTYRIWSQIKNRCLNENAKDFERYGGRGIKICDRWKNSFENFIADMGMCPRNHSIERIDNNGNYTLENCEWVEIKDQALNRRNTKIWVVDGVEYSMREAMQKYNVSDQTIRRWCLGFTDTRRGTTKPPKPNCERKNRYA